MSYFKLVLDECKGTFTASLLTSVGSLRAFSINTLYSSV